MTVLIELRPSRTPEGPPEPTSGSADVFAVRGAEAAAAAGPYVWLKCDFCSRFLYSLDFMFMLLMPLTSIKSGQFPARATAPLHLILMR